MSNMSQFNDSTYKQFQKCKWKEVTSLQEVQEGALETSLQGFPQDFILLWRGISYDAEVCDPTVAAIEQTKAPCAPTLPSYIPIWNQRKKLKLLMTRKNANANDKSNATR